MASFVLKHINALYVHIYRIFVRSTAEPVHRREEGGEESLVRLRAASDEELLCHPALMIIKVTLI